MAYAAAPDWTSANAAPAVMVPADARHAATNTHQHRKSVSATTLVHGNTTSVGVARSASAPSLSTSTAVRMDARDATTMQRTMMRNAVDAYAMAAYVDW